MTAYRVVDGALAVTMADGRATGLVEPSTFAGHTGDPNAPSSVLFRHHGLAIDILIDRTHPIGEVDEAGVTDIVLEAAVTVIMDCEDSVAAVDGKDKAAVYRN